MKSLKLSIHMQVRLQQSARRELATDGEQSSRGGHAQADGLSALMSAFGGKPPQPRQASIEVQQTSGSLNFGSVMPNQNFQPTPEPSMEGFEEEEFYCSADEFPCEGERMVSICIYSSYNGYQTLCISESKSDVLSYYDNSYCGKCVGGLGALLAKA